MQTDSFRDSLNVQANALRVNELGLGSCGRKSVALFSTKARLGRRVPPTDAGGCTPAATEDRPVGGGGQSRPRRFTALIWRVLTGVCAGVVLLLALGCAGYRVGPPSGLPAREKTVYVTPFSNRTLEPRLGEAVTQALRKRLSQEGTFKLVTRGSADIVVSGTLTQYSRQAVAYEHGDVITARDFEAILTARVIAEPTGGGPPLLDRDVRGRATFRIGRDQTTSERLALPALAEDVARQITSLLADGAW